MLVGWLAFASFTAAFSALSIPVGGALALPAAAILAGLAALPRARGARAEHPQPPAWDLPLRAACALALVLTLTAIAGWLGPQLSGLLAPFPIIATVLATFTHAQRGQQELLALLRGMVSGFGAFALFCFTLAVALPHLGTAASFVLASCLAILMQALLLVTMRARRAPATVRAAERALNAPSGKT